MSSFQALRPRSTRVKKNRQRDESKKAQFLREEKTIRIVPSTNEGGPIAISELRFQSVDSTQPDVRFIIEEEMWLNAHNQRKPHLFYAVSQDSIRKGIRNFDEQFPHFDTIQSKLNRSHPIAKSISPSLKEILTKELNQLFLLCTVKQSFPSPSFHREFPNATT